MKTQWTLHIKNFGRIKEAHIGISPLMMFIGDNNSGKSYLMTLLWGLISRSSYELMGVAQDYEALSTYEPCRKIIHKDILKKSSTGRVSWEEQEVFVNFFNEVLAKGKETLVTSLFHNTVPLEEMKIEMTSKKDYFLDQRKLKQWKEEAKNAEEDPLFFLYICMDICTQMLFVELCASSLSKDAPLFLPASRTGFMLTYKTLINESLRSRYGRNSDTGVSRFTLPIIEFLNRLVNLSNEKSSRFDHAVRMVEEELIHGKIVKDNAPVKSFYFDSLDVKEQLPLYLVSSLVTEVSPFLLFLTEAHNEFRTLIVEEPEAHLHLKAQIVMAKVLAIIVNQGTHVWMTTHSDTFFQQMNNLIKFKNHPKRDVLMEKYHIKEEECLDASMIKVYQFDTQGSSTVVSEVESSGTGFPAGTFNRVLDNLMDEVIELEED